MQKLNLNLLKPGNIINFPVLKDERMLYVLQKNVTILGQFQIFLTFNLIFQRSTALCLIILS